MATLACLAVAGCSTAAAPATADSAPIGDPDAAAAPAPDGGADAFDASAPSDAAPPEPYRHSITVDGTSSFTGAEVFATTTESFSAYATWDDDTLYIGYLGADVAADDPGKWLLVYLDVGAGGSPDGERYNTQTPGFPEGFRADYYYRWQSSGGIEDVTEWSGGAWRAAPQVAATSARGGSFLEAALPFADLGDPERLGLVLFWVNETDGLEAAYGGLYADSFTDCYHASIPVARYPSIDRASPLSPNDDANRRP